MHAFVFGVAVCFCDHGDIVPFAHVFDAVIQEGFDGRRHIVSGIPGERHGCLYSIDDGHFKSDEHLLCPETNRRFGWIDVLELKCRHAVSVDVHLCAHLFHLVLQHPCVGHILHDLDLQDSWADVFHVSLPLCV